MHDLAHIHRQLAVKQNAVPGAFHEVRAEIDDEVTRIFRLSASVATLARDFSGMSLKLNKGKAPVDVLGVPQAADLKVYARQLRHELDSFVAPRARHQVTVMHDRDAVAATVEITNRASEIPVVVRRVKGKDAKALHELLAAAEQRFSQWMYVKRSVRIMAGRKIHVIKPPRRLEWTRTSAMLDAADIVAEVMAARAVEAS